LNQLLQTLLHNYAQDATFNHRWATITTTLRNMFNHWATVTKTNYSDLIFLSLSYHIPTAQSIYSLLEEVAVAILFAH